MHVRMCVEDVCVISFSPSLSSSLSPSLPSPLFLPLSSPPPPPPLTPFLPVCHPLSPLLSPPPPPLSLVQWWMLAPLTRCSISTSGGCQRRPLKPLRQSCSRYSILQLGVRFSSVCVCVYMYMAGPGCRVYVCGVSWAWVRGYLST